MKKFIFGLIALLFLVTLIGCTQQETKYLTFENKNPDLKFIYPDYLGKANISTNDASSIYTVRFNNNTQLPTPSISGRIMPLDDYELKLFGWDESKRYYDLEYYVNNGSIKDINQGQFFEINGSKYYKVISDEAFIGPGSTTFILTVDKNILWTISIATPNSDGENKAVLEDFDKLINSLSFN